MPQPHLPQVVAQIAEFSSRRDLSGVTGLVDLVRELADFDCALVSTVTSDGERLMQRAQVVSLAPWTEFALTAQMEWAWIDGACREIADLPIDYVLDFAGTFLASAWAERGLRGFVSIPVRGSEGQVIGTVALLDFSGKSLQPDQLTLIRLCAVALSAAVERSFENLGAAPCSAQLRASRRAHDRAMNSLAAILGWLERAQGASAAVDREQALTASLARLEILRLELNELLLAGTSPRFE